MKKIYLLALATLFGIHAMAQQKSNVVVFAEDGETFFAFLNGVKQNTTAQSNVKIADIPGQGASLRVVFANSADQPLKQDLYFVDPNQEHTIKIKRDKKGVLKMRYFGAVPLAESTSSAPVVVYTATEAPANTNTNTTNTTGTVSNNTTTTTNTTGNTETVNMNTNMQVNDPNMNGTSSQTVTTTTTTTNSSTNGNSSNGSGSVNMNVGISENGLSMNMNVSGTGTGENGSVNMNVNGLETTETSSTTTTTTTTTSSSSSSGYSSSSSTTTNGNTGYTTSANGCSYAMDDASFAKMKTTVSSSPFDDTKLSTAKTATKGSCLSTDQVKEIMLLFTMDDDRMTYARYAYDYTVDKNNFYHLGEAFIYDGSKEDLNQFIESKR